MINVIVDLFQSCALILWVVMMILVTRRVGRLEKRHDRPREIIYHHTSEPAEPQAICGCGHHQCFHDETGCGKIEILRDVFRNEMLEEHVACGCKRYTGPEQLPQVIP